MAEERFEQVSANGQAAATCMQAKGSPSEKNRGTTAFRTITLIAVPFLWIGLFYSLYRGNESIQSWYSSLILLFSLLNADVLVKGEKLPNKALDVLAKANCMLLFLWAVYAIIHVVMG